MRLSLETAMVRGNHFTGAELVQLFDHPMLWAMLKNLIWLLAAHLTPSFTHMEILSQQLLIELLETPQEARHAAHQLLRARGFQIACVTLGFHAAPLFGHHVV
jgi:hypothetical protein